MDFLQEVGLEAIGRWNVQLSRALVEGGSERGLPLLGTADPNRKAPTTAFPVSGDAHAVEERLRAEGIIASARGPAIRLAPHFYTTLNDVEVALDALRRVLER
jgi:selenocysteine lyase/cysteine desulfurase